MRTPSFPAEHLIWRVEAADLRGTHRFPSVATSTPRPDRNRLPTRGVVCVVREVGVPGHPSGAGCRGTDPN